MEPYDPTRPQPPLDVVDTRVPPPPPPALPSDPPHPLPVSQAAGDETNKLHAEIERLTDALNAARADVTMLRAGGQKVYADLLEANKMLAAANSPTIGIKHPDKIADLPLLNDLPAHAALDESGGASGEPKSG